ncbi:MAG: hypothetical protein JNK04_23090 [Myxococcales bacterium]|nr:hypothetical protein [Myxococcales bacterium]
MIVFLVPPNTVAELTGDLAIVRAACTRADDPEVAALLDALAARELEARASGDVASAWHGSLGDATRALARMKKSLANHIRAGTEPPAAREELRALDAAINAVKRHRELPRR